MNLPTVQSKAVGNLVSLAVLGSLLPTFWSNCLAAWWLSGHGNIGRFTLLILGLSLLILGCALFKLAYHVELSLLIIPSNILFNNKLEQKHWWVICLSLLGIGLMVLLMSGDAPVFLALFISFFLITYGILFRASPVAAIFVGLARLCVYFLVASEGSRGITGELVWKALAIACYSGGACLAIKTRLRHPLWAPASVVGMAVPVLIALAESGFRFKILLVAVILGAWIWYCLRQLLAKESSHQPYAATDLVTGIILVDLLAIGAEPLLLATILAAIFLSTTLLQRKQLITSYF
jgi:hypothetical protein